MCTWMCSINISKFPNNACIHEIRSIGKVEIEKCIAFRQWLADEISVGEESEKEPRQQQKNIMQIAFFPSRVIFFNSVSTTHWQSHLTNVKRFFLVYFPLLYILCMCIYIVL